jgi:oxysterol-binding protein-related protein 9/10/11
MADNVKCTWEVTDKYPTIVGSGRKKSIVDDSDTSDKPIKLHYLTEQTNHHPPVSAYVVECPQKGIAARGYDQISAKFTGTSVKVGPGQHNEGIYITLQRRDDEEYHLTHPTAALGGLLRGTLSVSVSDTCFVTCQKTKIRAILQYQEEGWLGRTQNRVNGLVYHCDPETDKVTRPKDVPVKAVLARISGNWHDKLYYALEGGKVSYILPAFHPGHGLDSLVFEFQLTRNKGK